MPNILLADSFFDSVKDLDPADARRVSAFLGKLVQAPAGSSLHPEMVHDAADRSVHSLRVTRDMRAIVRVDGDDWLLLFAGRHDRAYTWARNSCIECHPVTGELSIVVAGADPARVPLVAHPCAGLDELCNVLERAGIAHALRA